MDNKVTCEMCGVCCKIFYINLNEEEYFSGKYKTFFENEVVLDNFSEIEGCGANFLAKFDNGSCIYLKDNKCSIHKNRPSVCRDFFCEGDENKFKEMRMMTQEAKNQN